MDKDVSPSLQEAFITSQYETLRREIEESKGRLFQIIVGGAGIVPVAQFVAETLQLSVITLVLPPIVLMVVFLFLSENNAMMRCGCYVRENIEPAILQGSGLVGWETWLELPREADPRNVDKYMIYSFYVLSIVYFIVAVFLAVQYVAGAYGTAVAIGALAGYGTLGIVGTVLLARGAMTTSKMGL